MGYEAHGGGTIMFAKQLSSREREKLAQILEDCFEYDIYEDKYRDKKTVADIWDSEKYYGDVVEETLETVSKRFKVEQGEIEYVGEDDSLWRFIYQNGEWKEQNGYVVYREN